MRRLIFALLIVCCAPLAVARGNLKDLTVPLKFVPQEGVHGSTVDLSAALLDQSVELRVEDARKLPDLLVIGSGTGGDDKPFPIHADRDVRAFIQDTLAAIGTAWSLKQQSPASRILKIQITGFAIDESNKAVGSVYSSEAKLAFTLMDAHEHALASGVGSGNAHRYGRAHSPDNINEVLSDALKEAYANVLADPALQSAWVSGKPAASATTVAAQATESVEERLRKLDELLKKGLITKEEYQKKRAEILKDL
jgi:putative oligomerization/nucleic acid binding protein/YajG family uncharacterized lipoprotein